MMVTYKVLAHPGDLVELPEGTTFPDLFQPAQHPCYRSIASWGHHIEVADGVELDPKFFERAGTAPPPPALDLVVYRVLSRSFIQYPTPHMASRGDLIELPASMKVEAWQFERVDGVAPMPLHQRGR